MLKIAKNGLILHYVDSFGFNQIFFRKSHPSDFVSVGDRRGPKILSPPPIKNLEKKPCMGTYWYRPTNQLEMSDANSCRKAQTSWDVFQITGNAINS